MPTVPAVVNHSVRLDKWLWAVRLFKTRAQAADACRLQRVKFNGAEVKAARDVRSGDVYEIQLDSMVRTVRVTALVERRVAGKFVENFLEDLTPADVVEAARVRREALRLSPTIAPDFRPSKKDRELLRQIYQADDADDGCEE
jgi:ribosome-associated heat shock protein Hsp15